MSNVDRRHRLCARLLFRRGRLQYNLSGVNCPRHASPSTACSLRATTLTNQNVSILFPDRPFTASNVQLCCTKRPKGGLLLFGHSHAFDSHCTVNEEKVFALDASAAVSLSALRIILRHVMSATADAPSTPSAWRTVFQTRYTETLCTEFDRYKVRAADDASMRQISALNNEFMKEYVDQKVLPSPHYFSKIKTYIGMKVIRPTCGMNQVHFIVKCT